MLPASLFPELSLLPIHAQLMLALVVGSGVFCLVVVAAGALRAWLRRCTSLPKPPFFPFIPDQLYTGIFILYLLWAAAEGVMTVTPQTGGSGMTLNWATLLLAVGIQLGIYLPMLLRYAVLHPWQRSTRPWWHSVTLPLAAWLFIYLSVMLLELGGFSSWLVRETGCPEHQELVLLFSRGDTMQRLYIIICAALVAPVAEECCFRGFLYTTLRHWGGCILAALASSILFAAIHASLAQMLPLTIFGLVQCVLYERYHTLWLPIAVHMLFNTTSLIAIALMQP